jgi:hypothetical protein
MSTKVASQSRWWGSYGPVLYVLWVYCFYAQPGVDRLQALQWVQSLFPNVFYFALAVAAFKRVVFWVGCAVVYVAGYRSAPAKTDDLDWLRPYKVEQVWILCVSLCLVCRAPRSLLTRRLFVGQALAVALTRRLATAHSFRSVAACAGA